ncbi:hypothetical protein ACHAWF_016970 [Thalassiosira exigua]
MASTDRDDGDLQLGLEYQVKLLELEFEELRKELRDEEERHVEEVQARQRKRIGGAEEERPNKSLNASADSSDEEDDVLRVEELKKQMVAEEEEMLCFVKQQQPPDDEPLTREEPIEIGDEMKSDGVRNLASMFERRHAPVDLPTPPPKPPPALPSRGSSTSSIGSRGLQLSPLTGPDGATKEVVSPQTDPGGSVTGKEDGVHEFASLSIREGKAMFERAFSASGRSESGRNVRSRAFGKQREMPEVRRQPTSEGSGLEAKPGTKSLKHTVDPPSSLKERIATIEKAHSVESPPPPKSKANKPVALEGSADSDSLQKTPTSEPIHYIAPTSSPTICKEDTVRGAGDLDECASLPSEPKPGSEPCAAPSPSLKDRISTIEKHQAFRSTLPESKANYLGLVSEARSGGAQEAAPPASSESMSERIETTTSPTPKERISLIEQSSSPKLPLPPGGKTSTLKVKSGAVESPCSPSPPTPPSDDLQQPENKDDCFGDKIVVGSPKTSKENTTALPPVPPMPAAPNETPPIHSHTNKGESFSICDDGEIQQRRAALIKGLKCHLNEKKRSSDSIGVGEVSITTLAGRAPPNDSEYTPFERHDVGHQSAPLLDERIEVKTKTAQSLPSQNNGPSVEAVAEVHMGPIFSSRNSLQTAFVKRDESDPELGLELTESNKMNTNFIGDIPRHVAPARTRRLAKRLTICLASSIDKMKACCIGGRRRLEPCLVSLGRCVGSLAVCCWINTLVEASKKSAISTLIFFREGVNSHLSVLSLTPEAAKAAASWAARLEPGVAMSFGSLLTTMLTNLYPTAPNCNVFMAVILLFFQIGALNDWQNEYRYSNILLVFAVALQICINIDWLSYKYFNLSLNQEEEFAYRLRQDGSFVYAAAWYGLLVNIFLQVFCLNEALKTSDHGQKIRRIFWQRVGKCLISSRIPEDLGLAVRDKVIALTWIECVCSLFYFGYFFVIQFDGVSGAFLQGDPNQVLSLEGALLLKATSGFFAFLSWAHHTNFRDFFGLVACYTVCPSLRGTQQIGRGRGRMRLRIKNSMKCIVFTKALDFVAGVFVWTQLVHVHRQTGFDAPKDITTLLGCIFSTQMFSSVIAPILGAVVLWYVRLPERSNENVREQAIAEDTPISERRERRKNRRFAPSSSKRSKRNPESRTASRTIPRLRMEELCLTNEVGYDLRSRPQISNSQTLFETRITGAAAQGAPAKSIELEENLVCNHRQFQAEWQSLHEGVRTFHKIHLAPDLSDCHRHFHARRFFVVGSGVLGNESRMFVIAQRHVDTQANRPSTLKAPMSRCLAEITFDSNRYQMKSEVRCRDQNEIRFFLNALELRELFGELS